ncbi:MAG: FAD-dependent oxidoreductase [Hellea sp.]
MKHRIAIIGAGLSGLTAARNLKTISDVKLFDKSRGVGGRMSTRYAGDYEFDHGAQYFTARDARFQAAIESAIEQGYVAPWEGRALYQQVFDMVADTGGDRFVGLPRMNSWPKALAQGLDITLGARVSKLSRIDGSWTLLFEDGTQQGGFDHVICAVPSAQAEDLLPDNFSAMETLKAAKMNACFALMVGFAGVHDFGWDSLRVNDSAVSWMAANSSKPGRNKAVTTLMVHAAPEWSNAHADADKNWVKSVLEAAIDELCDIDYTKSVHRILHRWLYASVSESPQQPALHDPALNIIACGDWCHGGRVEGAYLSGLAAANIIKASL